MSEYLTSIDHMLGLAVAAAEEKGAFAQLAFDVHEVFALADRFLVMSGSVERNVQAISDSVEEALDSAGVRTIRREGRELGRWVLLDFGDLIVHVFQQEERDFYQLERLWKDCPLVDISQWLSEPADLQERPSGDVS